MRAPDHRLCACQQFTGTERFGDIVIGANLETHDPVCVLSARDADGDGNLGLDEFAHPRRETMQPMIMRAFRMLDTDGDDVISRSEYEQPLADVVQELDHNTDGSLPALSASDRDGNDDDDHEWERLTSRDRGTGSDPPGSIMSRGASSTGAVLLPLRTR